MTTADMISETPLPAPPSAMSGHYHLERYVFLSIVAFSIVGEYLNNIWPSFSVWYWIVMMPTFAVVSIVTALSRANLHQTSALDTVMTQLAHWGGAFLALGVTYVLWRSGRLTNEASGSVAVLLLSLTTFLNGYHVGWRFYLAGLLLFGYTVLAIYLKGFIWLAIVLAVPVILVGWYWERHPFDRSARD